MFQRVYRSLQWSEMKDDLKTNLEEPRTQEIHFCWLFLYDMRHSVLSIALEK